MEENSLPPIPGQAIPNQIPVQSPPQVPMPSQFQPTYAGFWIRLAATYIDGIALGMSLTLVVVIISFALSSAGSIQENSLSNIFFSLAYFVIVIYFVTKYGATPGKKLYGLKIIKADGSIPDLKTAVLREVLGRILCVLTLNIGYLWVAFDKEKQGLNDKIAKTHVVMTRPLGGFLKVLIFIFAAFIPIAILGILAAVVLVAVNPVKRMDQAKDSVRKNDIGMISTELYSYYTLNNNRYPQTLDQLEASGGAKLIPKDTLGVDYNYRISADGSNAAVYAFLENGTVSKNAVWCWESSAIQAQEVASAADCQP